MPKENFLTNRARTYLAMSEAYAALAKMCEDWKLTPLSGDIQTEEQWANNVNHLSRQDYCPAERNNGILLTFRKHDRDFVICALHVNFDGTYYGTTKLGGNHDWNIGELKHSCQQAIEQLPTELPR